MYVYVYKVAKSQEYKLLQERLFQTKTGCSCFDRLIPSVKSVF